MARRIRSEVVAGRSSAPEQAPIQRYAAYVDGPALTERLLI
jgi:hypothetical protein